MGTPDAGRTDRSAFGPNAGFVDELRERYLEDPASVDPAWRAFFERDGGRPPPNPAPRDDDATPLTGAGALVARNMEASLGVPTATSFRTIPAKLLELNRRLLNRHRKDAGERKVSFTHLISYAIVRAVAESEAMRRTFGVVDGRPVVTRHAHIDLGIAVDVRRRDGSRLLLVPTIRRADTLDFAAFRGAYDDVVERARAGRSSPDELSGATITITNPGTIGTVQSVPRLMPGQAAIFGVGAIGLPAEYHGADPAVLAELGVSSVVTITSTYDHRVIQGAESGELLAHVHELLLGEHRFYGEIFDALDIPTRPIHWGEDRRPREGSPAAVERQARVLRLINAYRVRGHLIADLDPLASTPPPTHPELDPATWGFSIWDLDRRFPADGLAGLREAALQEIWDVLRDTYCGTLGIEYLHLQDPERKVWIQERVEGRRGELEPEERRRVLEALTEAEALERFLHTRYRGHKRFSLEGAESLIPILHATLDAAADGGVTEVVAGMAHRGRLNVLANVFGVDHGEIFRGFEEDPDPLSVEGSGDVAYHLGATGRHSSPSGNVVELTLASNPSHLESVDPVVEGMARARLDLSGADDTDSVLPLLIHGEAAFAGQGVVAETFHLSQLPGYHTGGTVHVIVNNQLGFTTEPEHGRSTVYPSDVGKMVQAPVFHVNGDDPEAGVRAARLAVEFRRAFHTDVVIDLWCYRRWGHNEADEPSFTQPLMYRGIEQRPSIRERYARRLAAGGVVSGEDAERSFRERTDRLGRAVDGGGDRRWPSRPRSPGRGTGPADSVPTGVTRDRLDRTLARILALPDGFTPHPKLARLLERRAAALRDGRVDWATAEALAFGTLLLEGTSVRLTGQDTRRGTFSQRHAVLVDYETGRPHFPFRHLADGQGQAWIYDSLLSEFAALAFEYGYSVANPDALVVWEAQFGDFVNGAQIVIDQYVVAAEERWGQRSGLVLLLPHGYEGQGPEHSSARLERFLDLVADNNLEVAVPSTAGQYFHLLRRQARRDDLRPLVVLTPKSLLRLEASAADAAELETGAFRPVLPDPQEVAAPGRIVLCQGKLFYELDRARSERSAHARLLRLERCAPFPVEELREAIGPGDGAELVWAQEEPENMGAGRFVVRNLRERLGLEARLVSRPASASPATGRRSIHEREQADLVGRA
ncbi:MAG TPA: multifunctional oxoglutarate decarboxylase/oxoglutarate dehydrogenase thiamine pyrophosphate-binding subunit/dihydrolipoyllysine-residue succinyltransferase subunit, partial [Actinomycetota bacterium]|nr:multifunctional oxoglutarate decarboxylase/oxoglutarate dehydrogenase thiamine pyrophosphate-binding subunit/dihydrolipoyllysine-residue succinyltransferase subunit [Actinomycetota bacterium]